MGGVPRTLQSQMPVLRVIDPETAKLGLYGTKVGVDKHATTTSSRGTTIVKSVQVFKVGTFKDSWGDQQTWTHAHLHAMVLHFELLRDVFPNVPVRNDHTFSVTDIVGYFAAVRVDGDFLVADLEFTDTTALEKFDNGTYRSRSIEIGLYETNNGETYYPVIMGLAFVDIPAVEGLHARDKNGIHTFRQEITVPDAPIQTGATTSTNPPAAPAAPAAAFVFNMAGQAPTSDFGIVQTYITKIEGQNATLLAENTKYEADFAKAAKDARIAFVKQLVADNKLVAPQEAPTTTLVEGMTDEAFEQFKAVFAAAPTAAILTPFANAATGSPAGGNPPASPDAPLTGEDLDYAKVAQFRAAGMSDEQIKNTPTGRKLIAAGKSLDK